MKLLFSLLLFCLVGNITVAQNNLKATQFIDELIAKKNADEISYISKVFTQRDISNKPIVRSDFFYRDSVGTQAIANMRQNLQRYKNVFHGVREDSVTYIDSAGKRSVLSRNNANYMAMKNIGPDGIIHSRIEVILADSLVITDEERAYIFAEINQMESYAWGKSSFSNVRLISADTVRQLFANVKDNSWAEMNKKGIGRIYNFSKPVFLRNDTFCFFYYDYSCGWLCGHGEFAIYKKENGKREMG